MQRSYMLAATAALALFMQGSLALAQSTPPAAGTAPAATAPAATSPAATPAQTTATPAATPDAGQAGDKKGASKKSSKKKMTRQQEIDHSIDSGTVPARYRSSVPKQYQQYIPFDKQ